MTQHVHFSIGPVQSFVAQSRRTRDLWGSSWLLSFLAAHAMSGARRAGATIVRPGVDADSMLRWIEGRGDNGPPRLGSLPNQFTVEIRDGVEPGSVASAAEHALREAWQRVCAAVWDRYVAGAVSAGSGTKAIWERQVGGFWEVIWVAGAPDDHGLLARRKLWRTHRLPEEGGDKCTVMPELEELSGYVRATDRERQDAFWSAIRSRTGELDLRENERLCAVALVKRLYPRVAQEAVGSELDVTHWPSTVDVAGPAVYFALLLADGDRLGRMVASLGSDVVSPALGRFTSAVPGIVKRHDGVTVYAGGDDVLALLPLEGALECARDMEREYRRSFEGASATLSAAVVFAHARDPLNRILAEAHRLLDEVAKEENGRSSLAAGVYRGGAAAVQWATTWERSSSEGAPKDAVECLRGVARELVAESGSLSGSLLQDLRRMLGRLCGTSSRAPGSFARLGEGIDVGALVRAEIAHRLGHHEGAPGPRDAGPLSSLVSDLLGRSRNGEAASSHVGIDGLLLASFLAGGGREEEHGP